MYSVMSILHYSEFVLRYLGTITHTACNSYRHLAQTNCADKGGELLAIYDDNIRREITSLVASVRGNQSIGYIWIGLNDLKTEGEWRWANGNMS